MSNAYNLTVQLNLQGPSNLSSIVNSINQQLGNINANVNVNIPTSTTQQIAQVNNNLQQCAQSATRATTTMESFGRAAGLAVRRFAAFTTATAGFYAITRATQQSLGKFIEFDRQITRIAQVTGTTKQSLSGLSQEITRLSVSLGASSSELAKVAVTLSQAGLSASETQKALKALALTNLAPTFSDMNQTVEGSIALMKQFSISTSQLEKALGSINAVAGSFAVEASDLITAIQRTGGVFASASQGVSQGTDALNEFLAVFTSIRATTRESAETIATGLRTIFTRLQREETIGALEAFGVKLTDLEGKFVGPYKAVEQLAKGLSQLDPRSLQFSGIIEELGGFRQVGKVIPLIQRFTTAQQALNVAQQGSGSLANSAATGQQALAVQISKVKEEFDALIRSIGETGEFRQFIRLSLDLASALIQVANAIKPVLPAIAALGAAKIVGGIAGFARGFRGGISGSGATGFATGGLVPGTGNTDSVRANLTPGEYVIRKKAVNAIGVENLEKMNRYAEGGAVQFPESKRYVKNTSTTYNKAPGMSIQDALIAETPLVLNPKDRIHASIYRKQFNGQQLANSNSKKPASQAYLQAKTPQTRGLAFENLLLATGQIKRKAGGSSRIDAIGNDGNFVEIKSTKGQYTDSVLMQKVAGSIFSPRSGIDKDAMLTASKTGMTNRPDTLSIGSLLVYEDSSAFSPGTQVLTGNARKGLGTRVRAANGGSISGRDTVPALLTPGEYVLSAGAASAIGERRLNQLNNADRIGYNSGGAVGRVRLTGGGWGGLGPYGMPATGTNPNSRHDRSSGGGMGAMTALFALQGVVSGLNSAIGEASVGAMQTTRSLQALATAVMAGTVAFQAMGGGKGGAVIAGLVGSIAAVDGIMKALGNSAADFNKQIGEKSFGQAMEQASQAIERFSQNATDAASKMAAMQAISRASEAARVIGEAESSGRVSLTQAMSDLGRGAASWWYGEDLMSETGNTDMDNARSRVRAQNGFFGGIREFWDPEQFNREAEANLAEVQQNEARRFGEVTSSIMGIGQLEVGRGMSIQDYYNSLRPDQREAIARSNSDVAARIDSATGQERENIINQEAMRQLNAGLASSVQQNAQNAANAAAQQLEVALERVFTKMEQNFAAAAVEIENRFGAAADSISAAMGKTNIGYNNTQVKSILDNPKAFSVQDIRQVIDSAAPLLGRNGGRMADLAMASVGMEENVSNIVDSVLTNPNISQGAKLSNIGGSLQMMIQNLGLGRDVEGVIGRQLEQAFKAAQQELGPNAEAGQIRQKVQEIVKNIPGLNGAFEVFKKAIEVTSTAQSKYSQAVQQFTEAVLYQLNYFNKAKEIRRNSDIELRKTLGENIGLDDVIRTTMASVADQTGGLTNVEDLFNQQQSLLQRREAINEQRNSISGLADRNADFMKLTQELADLDVQLSRNRSGLEILASSTAIASEALRQYSAIQQRAMEKASFAEKMVSASPEEARLMRENYAALQNIMEGGELNLSNSAPAQRAMMSSYSQGGTYMDVIDAGQTALAQQRGATMNLLKELKPFFGDDNKAFNEAYEKVLRSHLQANGMMNPAMEQMFAEMRGQTDEQQRALQVYERAIQIQEKANIALGNLVDPLQIMADANTNLAMAINNLSQSLGQVQFHSSGGVVYANDGMLVNMKPRGTDTVPAMLTPGEFVVNAKATSKHRGLLEQINGGASPENIGGVGYAQQGGFYDRAAARFMGYRRMYQSANGRVMPLAVQGQLKMKAIYDEQMQWMLDQQRDKNKGKTDFELAQEQQIRNRQAWVDRLNERKGQEWEKRQQRIEQRKQDRAQGTDTAPRTRPGPTTPSGSGQGYVRGYSTTPDYEGGTSQSERMAMLRREEEIEAPIIEQKRQEREARRAEMKASMEANRRRSQARAEKDWAEVDRQVTARGTIRWQEPENDPDWAQIGNTLIRNPDGSFGFMNSQIPRYRQEGYTSIGGVLGEMAEGDLPMPEWTQDLEMDLYDVEKERREKTRANLVSLMQRGVGTGVRMAGNAMSSIAGASGAVGSVLWKILKGTRQDDPNHPSNNPSRYKTRSRFPSFPNDGNIPREQKQSIPDETEADRILRERREEKWLESISGPSIGAAPGSVNTRFGTVSQSELESLARQPGETEAQHQRRMMEWKAGQLHPSTDPSLEGGLSYGNFKAGMDMLGTFGAGIVTTGRPVTGIGSRPSPRLPRPSSGKPPGRLHAPIERPGASTAPGATQRRTNTFGPGTPGTTEITLGGGSRPITSQIEASPRASRQQTKQQKTIEAVKLYNAIRGNGASHDEAIMHLHGQGYDVRKGEGILKNRYEGTQKPSPASPKPAATSSPKPVVRSQGNQTKPRPGLLPGGVDFRFPNQSGGELSLTRTELQMEGNPRGFAGSGYGGRYNLTPLYETTTGLSLRDAADVYLKRQIRQYQQQNSRIQRKSSGGIVSPAYLFGGGLARGTDKYPAMLSRGEMVMNAEATKNYQGILRSMNKSRGGIVRGGVLYAANGTDGPIGMPPMPSSSSSGGGFPDLSAAISIFTEAVNNFIPGIDAFRESSASMSTGFGVFNDGVTLMQQTVGLLNNAASSIATPISTFGQSIQDFVSKSANLISAISNIGEVNGTIRVTGKIDFSPITVQLSGGEILAALGPTIQTSVMRSVAYALENDNPGINTETLYSASSS